ncbi:ATP-binding protein [Bacteroides sp. 224]|uniref:ATP-binding protein n=1 Tax=Bacteroides sp. 224 TaxID=2302936 RepID=UPI0013D05E74|nr:ATP-binding protein [Bacteroides sp. 224]NDV66346.1 ATP-binding protein [Bacteroides sp. 224]
MIDEILRKKIFIPRPLYTEKIKPFIDKEIIKVITGQRRVGKSYILFQLIKDIQETDHSANIIYINKELQPHQHITDDAIFYQYVKELLQPNVKNYLFVDEIQEIKDFEKTLRSLLAENCCDIFCSGSNANMLSGELATFLAGRYIEFKIHSLGYEEFMRFLSLENSVQTLNKYLTIGGMPYIHIIGTEEFAVFEYLRNVYSTILLKDVVARENIRNVTFLENLVDFLADNVGNLFSASNIAKYLKSQHSSVSTQTVLNYLKPLSNAYFVHKVQRYDISGLKIFEVGEKYYFEDLGLRNCIRGFNIRKDIHKVMENAVYLHLIQLGYKVYVGQQASTEIDFVAEKDGQSVYIQVCYMLHDESTIQREFGNLLKIEDNYPKYVVTMDEYSAGSYNGILQLHLKDFLMKRSF